MTIRKLTDKANAAFQHVILGQYTNLEAAAQRNGITLDAQRKYDRVNKAMYKEREKAWDFTKDLSRRVNAHNLYLYEDPTRAGGYSARKRHMPYVRGQVANFTARERIRAEDDLKTIMPKLNAIENEYRPQLNAIVAAGRAPSAKRGQPKP